MGLLQAEQPMVGKEGIGPSRLICAVHLGNPLSFCCLRSKLRSRRRIQPSSVPNVLSRLCLKYSNQPRSVGFRLSMTMARLRPIVRFVFARKASLNFVRLFSRGHF
jgi:hypothetical protein